MNHIFLTANLIFPMWGLFLFPSVFIIWLLLGNFIIDSAVLLITMAVFKYDGKWKLWRSNIILIWIFGFLSDLIGALVNLAVCALFSSFTSLDFDAFLKTPTAQIFALPGIIAAGTAIYLFNYSVTFRKSSLDRGQIHRLAFWLAVITAPYTMLLPTV